MLRVLFYLFSAKIVLRLLFTLISRVTCLNFQNRSEKPFLFVCNHISHFDPPLLAAYYPQKIDFMAMKDLFRHPLGNWYFRGVDTFPVDREKADAQAVREALKRLKKGRIVGIFPEGGLRAGPDSVLEGAPLPAGAAVLSQMSKVKVRVCIVLGTDQLYRWQNILNRPRIFISMGKEFELDVSLSNKEARKHLNQQIEEEMHRLYDELKDRNDVCPEMYPQTAQQRWGIDGGVT